MIKPFAKPHILPFKPKKIERPSVPRRMTIIAGFSNSNGTILCADSQETSGGYAKRHVDKIAFNGNWSRDPENFPEFSYAMSAAGAGHYADMLTFDLRFSIHPAITKYDPEKIIDFIQQKVATFYEKHSLPRGENAPLEMLIVLLPNEGIGFPLILHVVETAVNVVQHGEHRCIGIGGYLGNFILERILSPYGSKQHLIAVAAYLLKQVRENVEGCGKQSKIYCFGRGAMDIVQEDYIERLEKLTQCTDEALASAFHYATDIENPDNPRPEFSHLEDELKELRIKYRTALEDHRAEVEFWGRNFGRITDKSS